MFSVQRSGYRVQRTNKNTQFAERSTDFHYTDYPVSVKISLFARRDDSYGRFAATVQSTAPL